MEDTNHDEIAIEPEQDVLDARLNVLEEKLSTCEGERKEYLEGWQRTKADLINYKRLVEQERQEIREQGSRVLIEDILPVVDTLNLAIGHSAWTDLPSDWRNGIEHVSSMLGAVLETHGVVRLAKKGDFFDPNKHEVTETLAVDVASEDNIVLEILQQGFSLRGKVLRPAKVRVGQYKSN